jgi:hypothetical protein
MSSFQKIDMNLFRQLIIYSILIFWINQFSYSQYLTHRRVDWTLLEDKVKDSVKLEYLKKTVESEYDNFSYLFSTSRFTSDLKYENYLTNELKKFHIIDINNDKLLDIVHESRVNELEDIVFYVNMVDSLRIGLKLLGYTETIKFQDNKLVSIQTIMPPCCCGFASYRIYYSFKEPKKKSKQVNNIDPASSSNYSELLNCRPIACEALGYFVLPQNDNLKEEFVSINSFYLTTNPKPILNKTIPDNVDCTYGMSFNNYNQVAKFDVNSKGMILSNFTSKDGTVYYFIKIINKISIQSIINIRDCYIYGWVPADKIK